ncbi:homocysteine S-methyltransferase family protein [Deltaproteobacteria bacterium TL4]
MLRPQFSLLKVLEKQAPLLGDGSVAFLLSNSGQPLDAPGFLANLSHPEKVQSFHQAYLQSGAAILRTNTAGAHRVNLEALTLLDRCEAINNLGVALLRESVGDQHITAGHITAIHSTKLLRETREKAYAEQAIYLSDTGAKVLVLSDFAEAEELKTA